jgi:hypothetical protein
LIPPGDNLISFGEFCAKAVDEGEDKRRTQWEEEDTCVFRARPEEGRPKRLMNRRQWRESAREKELTRASRGRVFPYRWDTVDYLTLGFFR